MLKLTIDAIPHDRVLTISEGRRVEPLFLERMPFATHITEESADDKTDGVLQCAKFALIILNVIRDMDIYALSIINKSRPPKNHLADFDAAFYQNVLYLYDLEKHIPRTNDFHGFMNTGWLDLFHKRGENDGIDRYTMRIQQALETALEFFSKCEDGESYVDMLRELDKPVRERHSVLCRFRSIFRDILNRLTIEKLHAYTVHHDVRTILINCGLAHYKDLIKRISESGEFSLHPIQKILEEIAIREALVATSSNDYVPKSITLCANCKIKPAEKVCARCRAVSYCSKECQRMHWKEHKASCIPVAPVSSKPANATARKRKSKRYSRKRQHRKR